MTCTQAFSFDMCDRMCTRQHTCKPICACCLSHAWKVIFSRKGLVHRIFFFQSFVYVYERHLWIMRYMSIAYRRWRLRRAEGHPKRKIGFVGFLRVGFQFRGLDTCEPHTQNRSHVRFTAHVSFCSRKGLCTVLCTVLKLYRKCTLKKIYKH